MCAQANPQGAFYICQSLHQLHRHQLGKDWQGNSRCGGSRTPGPHHSLVWCPRTIQTDNGLIKQQLTKLSIELRLSWLSLLPIALTCLRATPCSP
ncbi:hypothetical protein LEMLEM_LOCUS3994, partial [Lemmus lemmus]